MDNFVDRLEFLLENLEHSASSFADKIGVQRSSLSHLLSGRNKPSLDFILKINHAFPELSLEWLLKGDGSYLQEKNNNSSDNHTPLSAYTKDNHLDNSLKKSQKKQNKSGDKRQNNTPENTSKIKDKSPQNPLFNFTEKDDISQIVVFYTDGTFKTFTPR
ncbi:helix-turn-helix domain-containing protein [Myroides sp. LJL115]